MSAHNDPHAGAERPPDIAEDVRHDWKSEASGLAYMICEIHDRYLQAKQHLGGDSELLASSIFNAFKWVDGPMREIWNAELNDGEGGET